MEFDIPETLLALTKSTAIMSLVSN